MVADIPCRIELVLEMLASWLGPICRASLFGVRSAGTDKSADLVGTWLTPCLAAVVVI